MKLSQLLAGLDAALVGDADPDIVGATADSRRVRPDVVFAALKGLKADGADFVPQAIAAGAAAVLGDEAFDPARAAPLPVVRARDPRAVLARIAARLHPGQPTVVVGVTGTNGKTSTVDFLRQIWAAAGHEAASLGTLGVTRGDGAFEDLGHTTPDPVAVHETLDALAHDGVTHLAMEASSHGLHQRRLEAVRFAAVGFTNLTQDHLDYHPTLEDYFAAKLRLFTELAPSDAAAVINADGPFGERVLGACRTRGLRAVSVGWRGDDVRLRELMPRPAGQRLDLIVAGREHAVELPLAGEFQALNAIQALGLALATGVDAPAAVAALTRLAGVRGRMEHVGSTLDGAPVFVDYAHTPDGLDQLLRALRPHTRGKVTVVFGCGGDRDPGKRPLMGAVAARLADRVVVTDDNPRSEDPAAIRQAVLAGAANAREVADRAEAIAMAAADLAEGDSLVIAGKGHETGQIVGDQTIPFDDAVEARRVLTGLAEAAATSSGFDQDGLASAPPTGHKPRP